MIRSMTGYGEATAQQDGASFHAEVRSLNNKYFKAMIRLPDEYQGLEAEAEQRLRERLTRGTITLTLKCSDASEGAAHDINTRALQRYLEQIRAMPEPLREGVRLDMGSLLGLPGVLQAPANSEERFERARGTIAALLDRAVAGLISMREREGRALAADLEQHRAFIDERLERIAELAPGVIAEYERRLRARIDALLSEAEVALNPVDVVREIAVYAEKTDIAEEIHRLRGHLNQFRELLTSKDARPIGRTLDFLAQEMLREANTIASKSPDAGISRHAVEIKGAIDRIKEQAANVE